jgi:hypothetical protein
MSDLDSFRIFNKLWSNIQTNSTEILTIGKPEMIMKMWQEYGKTSTE